MKIWDPQCITKFFFTFTNVKYIQVQKARTRCWLGWAPRSASTISVPNMTYGTHTYDLHTPASLVRAGQGVSFVCFSFSFWVPLSQLKHHPETLDVTIGPFRPEAFWLFFLASSCASSSFILFRSCSNLQISACISCLWSIRSHTQLDIHFLSFSASFALWAKQVCFWYSLLISATTSSISVAKAVAMLSRTGPPRTPGEGDWPGSRKGIGTRIGSLLNLAKNFSFLGCPSSSCWGFCTWNPHRRSLWL